MKKMNCGILDADRSIFWCRNIENMVEKNLVKRRKKETFLHWSYVFDLGLS